MSIDDLSPETLERLKTSRWDRIIEKHEGPDSWEWQLRQPAPDDLIYRMDPDYDPVAETPEFMSIGGHWVLLPVGRKHHANITILHHFLSEDHTKIVIYLKDTTFYDDWSSAGFMTICDRQPDGFYVATLYHEWFIIDYDPEAKARFAS
ncbi:MAG: hypothetical protein H7Z72_07470 [Bacteroidetes bacterium]|nr:hypothetical protein [Fibrella sp.]